MSKRNKWKILCGCVALIILFSMCTAIGKDRDSTSDTDTAANAANSSETVNSEVVSSEIETDFSSEIVSNTDEKNSDTLTDNENKTNSETETNEEFYLDLTKDLYKEMDTTGLELFVGELQSINNCGDGVVVVKTKIQSSWNNEMTIQQNYHNVEDLIKNYGFDKCSEIQYWAVADMTSGDEEKVISFTVNSDVIEGVYKQNIVAIQMGDYVDDLWIHPSLQ